MSYKRQEKLMERLAEFVTQDLTYIGGECESGPNGAKKEYLQTGKTFLRALAKDLDFVESKVYAMPGGIGVAGEICLMGMWGGGNGIHVYIKENDFLGCILYRKISHMKDYTGERNRFLPLDYLLYGYGRLMSKFLELKREVGDNARAA